MRLYKLDKGTSFKTIRLSEIPVLAYHSVIKQTAIFLSLFFLHVTLLVVPLSLGAPSFSYFLSEPPSCFLIYSKQPLFFP